MAGAWGIGALLLVWCFREVLVEGRLLSYRDSLQFYYPLFDYIQQEWEAGRVPLWNPYTNGGEPLLANPTSSALYPLKVVFFLPVSYWARYHLYVLLHVALAGATCGWVARRWGASLAAATLAGISYAFCGNVLFNYCNVIFLCGAAWLPPALWSGERMLRRRSLRDVPGFAAMLALIALSGDIELAYMAGVLVALYALVLWRSPPDAIPPDVECGEGAPAKTSSRFLLLSAAAVLSILFAAAQLLPTMSFHGSSNRAERDAPASVYEIPRYLARRGELPLREDTREPARWYDAFVGDPPPPANHALFTYKFSVAPWRVFEFLWPNVSGKRLPFHHNWLEALDWAPAPWTDSMYMGLLPFLFAVSAARPGRGAPIVRWLSWTALLMVVAAWGSYGPGRLFDWGNPASEARAQTPHMLTGGIGGLYWLMTLLLPAFADFRYPAKLLVPAACALSLLAAVGFDRWVAGGHRRWIRGLGFLGAISAAAALALHVMDATVVEYFATNRVATAKTFLPAAAVSDLQAAFWHTAVLCGLAWLVLKRTGAASPGSGPPVVNETAMRRAPAGVWLLVLTAVDLAISNAALVLTTDRADWEKTPHLVDSLRRAAAIREPGAVRPPRVFVDENLRFRRTSEEVSEDEFVRHERACLSGTQNLPYRISRLCVPGTMEFSEQSTWFDTLPMREPRLIVQPRRSFDAWGVEYFVLPGTWHPDDPAAPMRGLRRRWPPEGPDPRFPIDPLGPPLDSALPDGDQPIPLLPTVQALYNDSAFPPAWVVHQVQPLAPIEAWDRKQWFPIMVSLTFPLPGERPKDLRREAYVEDEALHASLGSLPISWPVAGSEPETCTVTAYEPGRMELEAQLAGEGVVVLSEVFAAGWDATVSTDGGPFVAHPLLRTNRTMCGVRLPAGRHIVRLNYRPTTFLAGLVLSGLAWGGTIVWWGVGIVRRRRTIVAPSAARGPAEAGSELRSTPTAEPDARDSDRVQ
jgi:hypothetical protein